ncbi:MAG: CBS domain-containing protein [Alphaproteobacteria bacterium]|nr:CBS domain-containing protein [Alphaproteobacteria bacterium]
MNVDAILRNKGNAVETARPDWNVAQVCQRLNELEVGALLVSKGGQSVNGIVSERDVINHIAKEGAAVLDRPVSDIMIHDVVTCTRDDDIAHLMETMTERRIRHLPVVENDVLTGIFSIGDVVKYRIQETEYEAKALREYITTA